MKLEDLPRVNYLVDRLNSAYSDKQWVIQNTHIDEVTGQLYLRYPSCFKGEYTKACVRTTARYVNLQIKVVKEALKQLGVDTED